MKVLLISSLLVLLVACGTSKSPGPMVADQQTEQGNYIISAEVVELPMKMKNGKVAGYTDWYVRRSAQDYFIKFCESGITRKELEQTLNRENGTIKTLTMEVEYRNGLWDSCSDEIVQSRTGEYIVIHRLVN